MFHFFYQRKTQIGVYFKEQRRNTHCEFDGFLEKITLNVTKLNRKLKLVNLTVNFQCFKLKLFIIQHNFGNLRKSKQINNTPRQILISTIHIAAFIYIYVDIYKKIMIIIIVIVMTKFNILVV